MIDHRANAEDWLSVYPEKDAVAVLSLFQSSSLLFFLRCTAPYWRNILILSFFLAMKPVPQALTSVSCAGVQAQVGLSVLLHSSLVRGVGLASPFREKLRGGLVR